MEAKPARPVPTVSAPEAPQVGVKEDGSVVPAVPWFAGSLEDAVAKAKADRKLVFVDVGAYWCPPCHELDEKVFVDVEVGKFLDANYVPLHVDAEKGEGPEIVRRYRIQAYPTILVLDDKGIEKGRIVDFIAADKIVGALQRIATGENVLADLVEKVESDPDDLKAKLALGHAYALAANREAAQEQYAAIELADPKDEMGLASEVLYDRAMFFTYKLDRDLDKAIAQFEDLQRRFGDSKAALRAYRRIGRLQHLKGDDDAAIAALDKMLATDPEDPGLASSYGWFCFRQKTKPERGLEVVSAAVERLAVGAAPRGRRGVATSVGEAALGASPRRRSATAAPAGVATARSSSSVAAVECDVSASRRCGSLRNRDGASGCGASSATSTSICRAVFPAARFSTSR